jgi:hypothetical protein
MGLFDNLLGNASEVNTSSLESEFATLLISGEQIEHAYRLFRDLIVFTNKRLIMMDKQGLTGKKKEFLSIPYSNITKFSKESSGRFDADAEIKVWVRGDPGALQFEFRKDKNVDDVYRVLSAYILK